MAKTGPKTRAKKNARGGRKAFIALLEPDGTELKWVIARVPFDPAKAWPVRNGRRVRGEIEEFAFRTSLFPDPRTGGHLVLVNKKMQRGAHARVGDRVHIWLEPDLEERPVEIPPELACELNADRELRKWFDGMSKSMRRWIGQWAGEPKSVQSRQRRAERIAERLMQTMEGEKDPPPVLLAAFARIPAAREGWFTLTPIQRRNHLLGIFYYETVEGRERRAAQAIEDALKTAKRKRIGGRDEA
jgi:uncharacterized protein YdeI (YjbR/CyaY-like superfamily)